MSSSGHGVEPVGWPADATCDDLIGNWRIYQRAKGHKTSTDDVLTAWFACRCMGGDRPQRYLDLGCGIGSVLLMTCHVLRPAYALGVEAQSQSAAMAAASIQQLPDEENIEVKHADFRTAMLESTSRSFDLVTGSPPYFPVGTGVLPDDYQRTACRFELRGGVEAYFQAAKRAMTDEGKFVLVFQTEWVKRVMAAAKDSGLHLRQRADVSMRSDRERPFLSVYVFGRAAAGVHAMSFAIRDGHGQVTTDYLAIRGEMGLTTRS